MVRRRRRRSTSLGSLMIIFFLLVFLGGVVAVVSFLYRNQEKALELTEKFCPVEGPIYTLAILLDATDGVTEITKLSIKNKIENEIKNLQRYGKMELYVVSGEGLSLPLDEICNPGNKNDLSNLGQKGIVANPVLIQKKYNQFVSSSLTAVDKILNRSFEANESPLLKSIQKVSLLLKKPTDYSASHGASATRNKVIFITDFLENTDVFSMYGLKKSLLENFESSRAFENYGANFSEIDIEIWLVQRNHPNAPSTTEVKKFWFSVFKRYFDKTDPGTFQIIPLPGEL